MPTYCAVVGCTNVISDRCHVVPSNIDRRRVWLRAIGRPRETAQRILVCPAHFEPGAYEHNLAVRETLCKDTRRVLRRDAVPKLFLPQESPSPKRARVVSSISGFIGAVAEVDVVPISNIYVQAVSDDTLLSQTQPVSLPSTSYAPPTGPARTPLFQTSREKKRSVSCQTPRVPDCVSRKSVRTYSNYIVLTHQEDMY